VQENEVDEDMEVNADEEAYNKSWDKEGKRLVFDPEVVDQVLLQHRHQQVTKNRSTYFVYRCSNSKCTNIVPQKRDLKKAGLKKNATYMAVDHIDPWQNYLAHAPSSGEELDRLGLISHEAATAAYNDIQNLRGLCSQCNSSKGNKKYWRGMKVK
jgi:hypothetical protein